MSEPAFLLLGYALEHLLASGIIALLVLALCKAKAIPHGMKAGILLAALMLCVLGPVLSQSGNLGAGVGSPSWQANAMPMQAYAADLGRIDPDAANRASWAPGRIRLAEPAAWCLIALWFFGAAWQLARQAKGYGSLRRIIAASTRSRALERAYRPFIRSDVEIRLCASFGPAVAGVLRPKILIPESLAASLPDEAMRAVILHEASHIRRKDTAAHALQKIVEALFWWNPILRWMGTTLDVSREIACDIEASRLCETPADYADALLTAIEHVVPTRSVRLASALGVADAVRTLDQRIDGVIETRTASGATAKLASAAVLLSMAAACVAAEALSRPLAPIPAVPKAAAVEAPAEIARKDRISAGKAAQAAPRSVSAVAQFSTIAPAGQAASKPKAGEPSAAKRPEVDQEKLRLSMEEQIQRIASEADEAFRRAASQADETYRRSAAQAEEEYLAVTASADDAYQRRFEELERVTPAAAFEAGLAQISRARSQTVSAASGKYRERMAGATGTYQRQMAGATGTHALQMREAKQRYESMRASRLD
ncbi:MAG TPA: M56 family metallopeptidase [Luteimonas sp.]|nr:M56 family metallopeptidase [Luteimonas sp.]